MSHKKKKKEVNTINNSEVIAGQDVETESKESGEGQNVQAESDNVVVEKSPEEIRKEKKKRNRIILSTILFVFSVAITICLHRWINVNPFAPFALDNVYCATSDQEGNLYVVDDGYSRLLKISPDGKLIWKVEGSDSTFEKADNIVCDDDGNIYIHDVRILTGVRIASESIVKFSPEGKCLGEIKKWDYSGVRQAARNRMRAEVVGMAGQEHSVLYIQKMDNVLYAIDEQERSVEKFSLENAEDTVLSASYEDGDLYYTTYGGRLFQYVDGVNDKLLYDCDDVSGSIITDVSFNDGRLYVTDIGLRDILVVDTSDGGQSRLSFDEDVKEREITYKVDASRKVVSASSYSVSVWDGDDYTRYYEVELSTKWKILTAMLAASLLLLVITAVIDVLLFAFFIIRKASFYARIILAIIAGVFAMGVLFFGSSYPQFQDQFADAVFSREKLAADVTAERLPKDAFLNLDKPSDYMNDDFVKVKQVVDDMFMADSEDAKDLYCSMYRVIDETITLTYSMENVCVLYPYDWEYEGSDEQEIIETGQGKTYISTGIGGSYIFVLQPIFDDKGHVIGLIEVGKDLGGFIKENSTMLAALIINIIAMTMVIVMVVVEMFYYVAGRKQLGDIDELDAGTAGAEGGHTGVDVEDTESDSTGADVAGIESDSLDVDMVGTVANHEDRDKHEASDMAGAGTPTGILRFITFLIYFFTNLATAILPIYAMRIAGNSVTFGLSREVLSAIPISAEVAACAVFSFLGNKLIKRFGGRKTAFISAILITAGLVLRIVPNIWVLTLAQIIMGAGGGTLILMINILITGLPEDDRDKGFAYFSGASFSGGNCGILFGGFLIQWVSYSTLFLISAGISIILIFTAKRYMSDINTVQESEEGAGNVPAWKFVFNPRILAFVFLMLIPAAIVSYYVNYLYPILGEKWGLSETYIGYSYLIDAVFVLAFGGLLTKVFAKRKRLGVAVSSIVYAMAFVVVILMNNIPALFISLALVGLSDGFGNPLMTGYFTDLPEVEEYGYDRAFGIYSIFENIALSVGSFVFSYVLIMGVGKGLTVLAIALTALSLVFMVGGIFDKRRKHMKIAGEGEN